MNNIIHIGKVIPTKCGHSFVITGYINNNNVIGFFIGNNTTVTTSLRSVKKMSIRHPLDIPLILEGRVYSGRYGDFYLKIYNGSGEVVVKFLETGGETKTTIKACRDGIVKDYLYPTVCGVGYMGEGYFNTTKGGNGAVDKAYKKWEAMIRRVYPTNEKDARKYPTYKDCTITKNWFNFQNFARWFLDNYITLDCELDKDLLIKGNKFYSPSTCTLIPKEINTTLTKNDAGRSVLGIGVSIRASGNFRSNSKDGGCFSNSGDAFLEYKYCKEGRLKSLAEKYKTLISKEAYLALYRYKVDEAD
ncbi:homing endonuclease HNH [Shewanella sp. phage 1/40]|uniref:HNH endonuclease n=1 Tax=Shewanella sp. phage 1/40 TaxID=1458860 RepID=UPI0004F6AD78|nr:HNH endonuclease [Shewanella sp. phage 1/40]AHK11454.1 homing endonuclease HNH [Shewanella sp. phage 1/40]